MANTPSEFQVPYRDVLLGEEGFLSRPWQAFFRIVQEYIAPLGREKSFQIVNNQAVAANITDLNFDKSTVSQGVVEYCIQRITTGGGSTNLVQSGIFLCVYKPIADTWSIVTVGSSGPDISGVTFAITSAGQVTYTSSNITGTALLSRINFRVRTLQVKAAQYSVAGL